MLLSCYANVFDLKKNNYDFNQRMCCIFSPAIIYYTIIEKIAQSSNNTLENYNKQKRRKTTEKIQCNNEFINKKCHNTIIDL